MTVASKCSYCYHLHGWTCLIKTKSFYLSWGTLDSVTSLACFLPISLLWAVSVLVYRFWSFVIEELS